MTGDREAAVREAFAAQARWCRQLGSPFTALLCETIGIRLGRGTQVGRRVLGWTGVPDALNDSVPLRLAGGLHALVRRGRLPHLASLYPPSPPPPADRLWLEADAAFSDAASELLPWLDQAPQTNEVGRSAVLIAGLAAVAARTGMPLALHELGASAGLNLNLDRYDCRLGQRRHGDPASAVHLAPAWEGADPPGVPIRIATRRGVDLNPLDPTDPRDCERLVAYVWPDQADRLARLQGALAIAATAPPRVDRGDAAEWIAARIDRSAEPGTVRVVMHSIAFQYFTETTQDWIAARMAEAGAAATAAAPLAWLRYENDPEVGRPSLRLRLWPDGSDRRLALADAHGRTVTWLA